MVDGTYSISMRTPLGHHEGSVVLTRFRTLAGFGIPLRFTPGDS